LGGLRIEFDERLVATVDAPRLQSLLAYLLLNSEAPQPRGHLAFLFWPDSHESQSRTNLRQALFLLRRALPDADRFLEVSAATVRWRGDAGFSLDVAEFDRLTTGAEEARKAGASSELRAELEAAVTLYAGDLLPGCYDDWLVPERERLRAAFLRAAELLAELLELERDYRGAISWARRLLEHDPVNEFACQRLMRLYALSGDRAAALRVYHGCATALAREVGIAPSAATRDAYERLLEPDAAPVPTRTSKLAAAGMRLVGRSEEWHALRDAWRRAVGGESRLTVIAGEAGVGKSRLAEELRDWAARQGFVTAASRCYAAAGSLAYAPVVELLRSRAIAPGLRRLGDPWLAELARLLPEVHADRPELPAAPPLSDDWQRSRLLDAISHAVLAEGRPLLLVIDDLQWCDIETIGWLHYLLRSRSRARFLVVGTVRSEEVGLQDPLQSLLLDVRASGQLTELELGPLRRADTAMLARAVSGRDLDDAQADVLYRETEGNPLFVVEWVRAGLVDAEPPRRASTEAEAGWQLPPRAHSVIEARLGQLSPVGQELASLAATVGRAFAFDVLEQASPRSEEQIVEALDELWQRRIVRERGLDAYDFTHDKLREAAYRRTGSARRRMLHRRVAQALERLHGEDLDSVSGQLAAHYEYAGWIERSIDFYTRAATVAQDVYANAEAVAQLSRALELLAGQPPDARRDRRELALRTALGGALCVHRGYGAQEVSDTYARAWELCERLDDDPAAAVIRGVALSALTRGELRTARELGARLVTLGESGGDAMVVVEGHYMLGVAAFWLGELVVARDHLEQAVAGYAPERARSHLVLFAQDPRIICLSRLAYTLWHLGCREEAERRADEALRLAAELEHPFSLAYALNFASWLAIDSGDEPRARVLAERLAGLADEQRLGLMQPMGTILRGWASVHDGRAAEGIAMIREGLDVYRRSGQPLYMPWALGLLANVCLAERRLGLARAALTEALDVVEATGQRVLEAELHGLMGELVLAEADDLTEAERHFARALEIARRQGAVVLERRAVARLERAGATAPRNAERTVSERSPVYTSASTRGASDPGQDR
ncbi:MAG: AAA family ATPase, partial [Actinobacteria bacterium]|nr:AAA family ATPase [Actinomycetota bacterium]